MEVVTCPERLGALRDDPLVFMGGGISNCPNWQQEIIPMFQGQNVVLMNPRRDDFDITDKEMSRAQIYWEHDHLNAADAIIFWFPKETLCPITLFELGKYAAQGYQVFVGCHPEYARKFDVEVQLSLIDDTIQVYESLEEVVEVVTRWLRDF